MDELRWVGVAEQLRMVEAGEVSAYELRRLAIRAIERLDPDLHAVVIPLYDRPGDGVPFLLKDAGQEIANTPHWVGVAALREAGSRSDHTTGLVSRFEAAGLTAIGRSACPQLSTGATTEPDGFEPTANPWDPTRSAGGSSGGAAAAVAAGLVPVAHGSDATGSLRCPAALCGVATLVPTAGLIEGVPPAGQPPNEAWRDFVLSRHADDLRWAFTTLTGRTVGERSVPPGLRVGILDHDPELGLPVHPACSAAVQLAAELLEAMGHHVEVAWPPVLDQLWSRCALDFGVVSDATRPPVIEWVSGRLGRPVKQGELDESVFVAADRAATRRDDEVARAQAAIDATIAPVHRWWDDFDLLLTPSTFQPAGELGSNPGPAEMGILLAPFSLSGQPALSLPLHRTDEGLPVGVQVVGRRGDDELLLELARRVQAAMDWSDERPPVS